MWTGSKTSEIFLDTSLDVYLTSADAATEDLCGCVTIYRNCLRGP